MDNQYGGNHLNWTLNQRAGQTNLVLNICSNLRWKAFFGEFYLNDCDHGRESAPVRMKPSDGQYYCLGIAFHEPGQKQYI